MKNILILVTLTALLTGCLGTKEISKFKKETKVDSLIEKKEDFQIETRFGSFRLRAYQQTTNNQIHIALTKGQWKTSEPVLTRVNASLVNNDILGTLTNNADKQLDDMFKAIKNLIEKNNSGKLKSREVGFIVVLKSGPDPLIGTEYIRKIVANVVPEFSSENITNDFTIAGATPRK